MSRKSETAMQAQLAQGHRWMAWGPGERVQARRHAHGNAPP
ncbi:E3 ubiquitin ligase family protein [Escherichia coli]|nr:E3 ubiquitin ligase family protein [Escherichia coli]